MHTFHTKNAWRHTPAILTCVEHRGSVVRPSLPTEHCFLRAKIRARLILAATVESVRAVAVTMAAYQRNPEFLNIKQHKRSYVHVICMRVLSYCSCLLKSQSTSNLASSFTTKKLYMP